MSVLPVTIRQLEVFVALADLGQVTRAAQFLSITQPAASMALSELERQLGDLFEREKGRLILNAHGQQTLPLAREILQRVADLSMVQTGAPLRGELRIGASNTVGNYYIGELLADFVDAHTEVQLHVTVGGTQSILEQLRAHTLDVACVEGTVLHDTLTVTPWRQDALVLCASSGHPLAHKHVLDVADLAGAHWILREPGSATRRQTEMLLSRFPQGKVVLELGQVEAILHAVIAGLGVACLPLVAVEHAVARGELCVLPTPFTPHLRDLSLVLPSFSYRGRIVDAFVETVIGNRPAQK